MREPGIELLSSAADAAIPDAPASAVPQALRQLVREERLARPSGRRTLAHLAPIAGGWVGLATVGFAVDSLVAWIPIWLALAFCTATPLALMHEAVHHNLFASRAVNHAVGTVAATMLFFHAPAYRAWHLTHHAYTFEPGDSEQLPDRFRSKLAYVGYCLVLGPTFALILWYGAIATLLGHPPRWIGTTRLQRHVRRWALAPLIVIGGIVALGTIWPAVVVKAWLVPALGGSVLVFPLLTMPEHFEGKGRAGLLHNTRTTVSNPVVRYLYWNNNFHTAHHLVPTVPPHQLGRVDARVGADNTLRERGFLAFHRRVLTALPWI
jgi:fatty acid desaturase